MIITISIKLISGMYAKDDWECKLEVDENIDLNELHDAIQRAVNFDNDHMYEFFISRRCFGSDRISFDDREYSLDTELLSLFPLPKGRKLFYCFDFGDDWIFQISKTRKKPQKANVGQAYPFLSSEIGKKPEQYPEDDW